MEIMVSEGDNDIPALYTIISVKIKQWMYV